MTVQKKATRGRKNVKNRRATLKDVAELAGVCVNTASTVLNPRRTKLAVSSTTREKVKRAAQKLDYRRNVGAARLAGSATRVLAILTDRITTLFNAPIIGGFESEAIARGYQCLIGCTHYEGPRKLEYLRSFEEHGVDGILFTTIWEDPEVERAMQAMLENNVPSVFLDYPWRQYKAPLVCGNHRQGAHLLASHLIEQGHRALAFLVPEGEKDRMPVKERMWGMQIAMEESGFDMAPLRIIRAKRNEPEDLTRLVLAELESDSPPSAVQVVNDHQAYRLMMGLHACGRRVPDDVAVTGFDDLSGWFLRSLGLPTDGSFPWAIPLTTVRQPLNEIGTRAAQVLIEMLESDKPMRADVYSLDLELVVRESSALPQRCRSMESAAVQASETID